MEPNTTKNTKRMQGTERIHDYFSPGSLPVRFLSFLFVIFRAFRGKSFSSSLPFPSWPGGSADRRRVALGEAALVPVGIGRRRGAGGVEPGDLLRRQVPADGAEVLAQLLLVAGADDDVRDASAAGAASSARSAAPSCRSPWRPRRGRRRPGRGTRRRPAGRCRSTSLLWSRLVSRQRLAAADLAGEPAPAERAPDDRADLLVERQRHQLPLVVAADQRVVRLVGDVAGQAVLLRDRQRLHQVPAGEVRAADVADLAGAHQVVERAQRPPRPASWRRSRAAGRGRCSRCRAARRLASTARIRWYREEPTSLGPWPARKVPLVEMMHLVAPALDRLAQDLLGHARRE